MEDSNHSQHPPLTHSHSHSHLSIWNYIGYAVLIVGSLLFLFLGFLLVLGLFLPTNATAYDVSVSPYNAQTSSTKKIALLDLKGAIGDVEPASITPEHIRKSLRYIKKEQYDAILLSVNSPGGGVTASDIIYHQLSSFKEENQIPIYAQFQSVAASGGYYISMSADKIYGQPTGITGSIGVISNIMQAHELMKKVGLDVETIKSPSVTRETSFKDMGSSYRPMDPEERKLFQNLVDQMWANFVQVVVAGRSPILNQEQVEKLADGRVFTTQDAKSAGLIDEIAYLDETLAQLAEEIGDPNANIHKITPAADFSQYLSLVGKSTTSLSLDLPIHKPLETLEYRWALAPDTHAR